MKELFATPQIYYCETPIFGEYFQPLNTISNFVFILVAILFHVRLKKAKRIDFRFKVFFWMMIVFGLGSAAWHTYPTFWTWIWDVLPPSLFFVYLNYFLFIRILPSVRLGQIWFVIALIWTFVMTFVLQYAFDKSLNGAETYISQMAFQVALGVYAYLRKNSVAKWVFLMIGIFLVQLFFRQNDRTFCDSWPYGLHFLWHLSGGFTFYLGLYIIYFTKIASQNIASKT